MTDCYAVIGNPVVHSKSPLIHASFAAETRQDLDYIALEAPVGGFSSCAASFRLDGGRGLNITTPFKVDAVAYATELSQQARLAGAINALKFEGERALGENFDGTGLITDITRNLGCPIGGRSVLLLGAGGAARGAILPILAQRPVRLVIANRHVDKAQALAQQFRAYGAITALGYPALGREQTFDLVVNATSASLHNDLPPVPQHSFAAGGLAYDMVYGRGLTPFLRVARGAGTARIADGVGMLVEQAAEAFEWWRGVRPDTRTMIERLTVPLA